MDLHLSVVMALSDPRFDGRSCIDSLLSQRRPPALALQVLAVKGGASGGQADPLFQACELVRLPCGAASLPQLFGAGIEAASGAWVAFTEGHCTFAPGWLEEAVAMMGQPKAVAVGGAVEPGDLRTLTDWALYFCDYAAFLPPLPGGPTSDLAGNNVLFRRVVLERLAAPAERGFWKTFFCRQLAAQGEELLADPALVVRFHRRLSLSELLDRRLVHGRCYGAMRSERLRAWQRAGYALVAPLLPFVLLARLLRSAWPRKRYRRQLISALPAVFLALVAWVAGEWFGNLYGAGKCCSRV